MSLMARKKNRPLHEIILSSTRTKGEIVAVEPTPFEYKRETEIKTVGSVCFLFNGKINYE